MEESPAKPGYWVPANGMQGSPLRYERRVN
jgi:hypothetical protein